MSHAGSPTTDDAVRARRHEVEEHIDHGHSAAGWTAAGLALLGSGVASVAMVFAMVWLFWVGMAVMLLGLPVGFVMGKAGLGRRPHDAHSAAHGHAEKGVR